LSSGNIKTEKDLSEHLDIICPDPDIILRPGGEKRLSNFLIWQSAYAELFFEDFLFPEIDENKMNNIIKNFNKRKRNFGG
jgi:undecaprenyl diphosphate synthase